MSDNTVDPARCPLCGGANRCAMACTPQAAPGLTPVAVVPACWCTEVRFDPALLARIPPEARRRACVCQRCAEAGDAPSPVTPP